MKADQFKLHADIEEKHWWFVARRKIMRELVHRAAPPSKETIVVDVGCGTGGNIAALAKEYACIGIDTSEQGIASASNRYHDVKFICGYAPADLGETMQQAKVFLIMDVLEHVPDDFMFLSNLLAASAPGAHFLITVPADLSLWSEHDISFGHYRRYDKKRLEMVWQSLPVTARLVSYYNSRLYPVVKGVRTLSRLRGHAGGAAGTDFKMPGKRVNSMLTDIFYSETKVLVNALADGQARGQSAGRSAGKRAGYNSGVSLIALLRREDGAITPRSKPPTAPPDYHNPEG